MKVVQNQWSDHCHTTHLNKTYCSVISDWNTETLAQAQLVYLLTTPPSMTSV